MHESSIALLRTAISIREDSNSAIRTGLRDLMRLKGWSQRQLAARLDLTEVGLSKVLNGHSRPSNTTVDSILHLLEDIS